MPGKRWKQLGNSVSAWDHFQSGWEDGFAALQSFKARDGHCFVPALHIEGAFNLGIWVGVQRINQDAMPIELVQRLDAIGFVWNHLQHQWEEGFAALEAFKAREGHCRVPLSQFERTFWLGQWVSKQRRSKDTISAEHRKRLEEIGFYWDVRAITWEQGFAALQEFKAREGHCCVPQRCIQGAVTLGRWVNQQRRAKDSMPADCRQRLDEIGFVWRVK
jgi:hypothetical protein